MYVRNLKDSQISLVEVLNFINTLWISKARYLEGYLRYKY